MLSSIWKKKKLWKANDVYRRPSVSRKISQQIKWSDSVNIKSWLKSSRTKYLKKVLFSSMTD